MGRLTRDPPPWNKGRECDFVVACIALCFGLLKTGRAFTGGLLARLLGRGEFRVKVEVCRGQNSLGETLLVAVALVAAAQRGGQQEESEKL